MARKSWETNKEEAFVQEQGQNKAVLTPTG